jgi:hypothetical protein
MAARMGRRKGSAPSLFVGAVCAERAEAQECGFAIRPRPSPTMAEPHEAPLAASGHDDPAAARRRHDSLFSTPATVIQTATAAGYGLWMVLGTGLALGTYPDGRGDTLVPLSVGLVLVSIGLAATILRLPFAPAWHGWNPAQRMMPTAEGMVAMMNYLPMLALAGLVRGDNDFWATRLAGAALMLCSLATLVYTTRGVARDLPPPVATAASGLPLGRVVSALFAGGLWFWLCAAMQSDTPATTSSPWRLGLLAVGLMLGIIEGLRWRTLRQMAEDTQSAPGSRAAATLLAWRFAVAVLSIGVPCLLLVGRADADGTAWAAALAALSCVVGQCLEQRLYGRACAQWTAA